MTQAPTTSEHGAHIEEKDLMAAIEAVAEHRAAGEHTKLEGLSQINCLGCGARVQFLGWLPGSECPYCATPVDRNAVCDAEGDVPVDAILPFLVERETAGENMAGWIGSRWFAPKGFLRRGAEGQFSGVYMPYWTFDAMTTNRYAGERGDEFHTAADPSKREQHIRWHSVSGTFRRFFDDVLVVAGEGLDRKVVRSLEPWPLDMCVPYAPEALTAYLARVHDVSLKMGFQEAKKRIRDGIHRATEEEIGGDAQRVHSVQTKYGELTYKHVLLPVWILVYRYAGKPYQVIVNAATGEVQGQRPYSRAKIALFALAVTGIVTGVIGMFAAFAGQG